MLVALMGKVYLASDDRLTSVFRVCTAHLQMFLCGAGNTAPALERTDATSPMQIGAWCQSAVLSLQVSSSWLAVFAVVAQFFCS